jgi:hypothetical protein
MPDLSATDLLANAQGAQDALRQGAAALDSVGADSSALKQAGSALAAAIGAAGTGAAVAGVAGAVLAGSALGATLGVSAASGALAGGPLAFVTVPVAMFIGVCIWVAETFPAANVRTPAERAAGAKIMRDAAEKASAALTWLDQPAHLPQRLAAQQSGWYDAALDALEYIADDGYGGILASDGDLYAAAHAFRLAHLDPLAAFPVPDSARDAMRLSMGKAGVFLGTSTQIAATKKAVHVARTLHLALLPKKSVFASTSKTKTFAQMLGLGGGLASTTQTQTIAQMTTPQLRSHVAAARAPAPKKSSAGALGVAAAIASYLLWM